MTQADKFSRALQTKTSRGPLAGIRVIELAVNVLGPLATQILGDMGADVIKVEPPDGDPMRQNGATNVPGMAQVFMNTNRNKRSVVLDLKRPKSLEALTRLVSSADVFVHTMRPAAIGRLGLGYDGISRLNPGIIYASAAGYRADGPNCNRPAFDDVIQGESGIVDMIARANGEPRYIPMVIADKFCGHVLASAIVMALFHRERAGVGQEVQVPMLETMLSFNLIEHLWIDMLSPGKQGAGYDRMFSQHRRPYPTKDGYICVIAVSDAQWQRLLAVLGVPKLATDERFARMTNRTQHIDQLYAIVADRIRLRTTAEWRDLLDEADISNGPVSQFKNFADDPYLAATNFFMRYTHPIAGLAVTTSVPVQFSRTPGGIRLYPPALGEHTNSVLQEAGYDNDQISDICMTNIDPVFSGTQEQSQTT